MMKNIGKILFLTLCLALTGCGSQKKAAETIVTEKETTATAEKKTTKKESEGQKRQEITVERFVSDLSVSVTMDSNKYSLGGKISMKRGEVMRINLTFMGFVEVGILEFTPENILIVNRIEKEYTRMPYDAFDALRKNNITYANMEYLAWQKLYNTTSDDMQELDKAIENLINTNLKGGKNVKVRIKVGKPDTSRDFDTQTKLKSSYKEVAPELLMARLMSFAGK